METLKKFNSIVEPDERQKHFILYDEVLGHDRALEINDFYAIAEKIKLHDKVPEIVRSHFATAQNLLVYSWFFYPFNVTAEFIAYTTLELALKEKFKVQKRTSFRSLVEKAVKEGIVKDEGFSHYQAILKNSKSYLTNPSEEVDEIIKYTDILIETIPYFRNEYAHGSNILHNGGAFNVQLCADFINQLFKE